MIRRLALLTAAIAGLGALASPAAQAEERTSLQGPKLGCVWVFDTLVCLDNPLRKIP